MSGYQPGDEFQCLSIPIKFAKIPSDPTKQGPPLRAGFTITGGIDVNISNTPYKDPGIYITNLAPDGPAIRAGMKVGDRILQCNGHDFTLVTHRKAVEYILKYPVLEMLIEREDECVTV